MGKSMFGDREHDSKDSKDQQLPQQPATPSRRQSPMLPRVDPRQHNIDERLERLEIALGQIASVQAQLLFDFSDFRYQASRSQQWIMDSLAAFFRHQGFTDFAPPPSIQFSAPESFETESTMTVDLQPPPSKHDNKAGPSHTVDDDA